MFSLDFSDKQVAYSTFVNDIAATVVKMLSESRNDAEFISQRRAYAMFGRGNVDRWRRQGKIEPFKRPGKIEYRTAELRILQRVKQDYFNF
jgi:hypothetical protein